MRKSLLSLLIWLLVIPQLLAQILMPSRDGEQKMYSITEPQYFFDPGGEQGELVRGQYVSLLNFSPREGEVIEVEFQEYNLSGAYLRFYDGEKRLVSEYDEQEEVTTYTLPLGQKKLSTITASTIIRSSSSDGKLTIGFMTAQGSGRGWKAVVRSVPRPTITAQPAPEVINFPSDPSIFLIDQPTPFYDDGGVNGKITANFSSSVIFRPQDNQKRLSIEFSQLDLFNTSTTGNNDVLEIYQGEENVRSKLIATILKQSTPFVVHAPEAGESLLVVLKSKAGTPKSGFKALVTASLPQPMSLGNQSISYPEIEKLNAGDTDQQVCLLHINTIESLNPLQLQRVRVHTTGLTRSVVAKASLFSWDGSRLLQKLAEVAPTEDEHITFDLPAPLSLQEGENRFALVYDIQDTAEDGQSLGIESFDVQINGTSHQLFGASPKNYTIKTEYLSTLGIHRRRIKGNWTFRHSPISTYNTRYKAEQGVQQITFIPTTPGAKVQIQFSSFDLQYEKALGRTQARFEIYSGETPTESQRLWKVDYDSKNTGPGKTIRSTAPDGSLTIVFDAQTTISYQTRNGWEAQVSEYIGQPMHWLGASVEQMNTESLRPGSEMNEIARLTLLTEHEEQPLSLNAIKINLKGVQSYLSSVALYPALADGSVDTRTPLMKVTSLEDETLNLHLPQPYTLRSGKTYIYIMYSLRSDAPLGRSVDVAIPEVQIGETSYVPDPQDPEGNRLIQQTYNLTDLVESISEVVSVDGSLLFYDHGGKTGKYNRGQNGRVRFVPAHTGEVLQLHIKQLTLSGRDKLNVYAGANLEEVNLLHAYMSSNKSPETILSTAPDGSLTFDFVSKGYSGNEGWEIEIRSIRPTPLSLSGSQVARIEEGSLLSGMQTIPLARLTLEVSGDRGELPINTLQLKLQDPDNFSLLGIYLTEGDEFHTNMPLSVKEQPLSQLIEFNFDDKAILRHPGQYSLWLVADISATPSSPHIGLQPLRLITTGAVTDLSTNPYSWTIGSGIHGEFVVGQSSEATYRDLQTAINDIKTKGMDGPVRLMLENGTYTTPIEIPEIRGASASNTLYIASRSARADEVIYSLDRVAPTSGYDASKEKIGLWTIKGADYLTIEHISFRSSLENLTADTPLVLVTNHSQHVSLRNLKLSALRSTTTTGVRLVEVSVVNNEKKNYNCDYFTLEGSQLRGGAIGVYINGTSYVNNPKQKGAKILNNELDGQGRMGIYLTKEHDAEIVGNYIHTTGGIDEYKAIDAVMIGNTLIAGNRIHAVALEKVARYRPKYYAIYMRARDTNESLAGENRVVNNEIIVETSSKGDFSDISAFYHSDTNLSSLLLAHNSVRMYGTKEAQIIRADINKSDAPTQIRYINNLFQNETPGPLHRFSNKNYQAISFAHNALSTSGSMSISLDGTPKDWNAILTKEDGSVRTQAQFLSDTSLDLKSSESLRIGQRLPSVLTDIKGRTRGEEVFVGAYEFEPIVMPQWVEGYPKLLSTSPTMVSLQLNLTAKGIVRYLVLPEEAIAPAETDWTTAPKLTLSSGQVVDIQLSDLQPHTSYRIYFRLEDLHGGVNSEIQSLVIRTSYLPTATATFEATSSSADIVDGTTRFKGFEVVDVENSPISDSHKALRLSGRGSIELLNTDNGLVVDGCYIQTSKPITITPHKGDQIGSPVSIPATQGRWTYISLRSLGEVTSLDLEGELLLDNYAGVPQTLSLQPQTIQVNAGEVAHLSLPVQGGAYPLQYQWLDARGEELGNSSALDFRPEYTTMVRCRISDAWGSVAEERAVVLVRGVASVATFEDLPTPASGYWQGDAQRKTSLFYSGSYSFSNIYSPELSSWTGFAYSNSTSTTFNGLQDQFNSSVGSGAENSATYAVAYTLGSQPEIRPTHTDSQVITGFYIANNSWVKKVSQEGTGMGATPDQPFTDGDWYKITATGSNGKSLDYYLADYRSANPQEHYTTSGWQWFDLRPLGAVSFVRFSADGTRRNSQGSTIPFYFCMDNLGGTPMMETLPTLTVQPNKSIEKALGELLPNLTDRHQVSLFDLSDNIKLQGAITSTKTLQLTTTESGEYVIVLKVTRSGDSQFYKLPIQVQESTGIEDVGAEESLRISPNPVRTSFRINKSGRVEIFDLRGFSVLQTNYEVNQTLDISHLPSGVYILRLGRERVRLVKE